MSDDELRRENMRRQGLPAIGDDKPDDPLPCLRIDWATGEIVEW